MDHQTFPPNLHKRGKNHQHHHHGCFMKCPFQTLREADSSASFQVCLKGTQSQDESWPKKRRKWANVSSLQAPYGGFIHVFCKRSNFWLRISAPQGAAMWIRSFPMRGRKRLACAKLDIYATHANLVHDVTDIDC